MKKIVVILLLSFLCATSYAAPEKWSVWSGDNSTGVTITLDKPEVKAGKILERLPGPTWPAHCLMCLGNHLISSHNISGAYMGSNLITSGYLNEIGYSQWQTLHDNLHNSGQTGEIKPIDDVSVFVPTPVAIISKALKAADITSNDIIYDLGCGDGRVCIVASKLYRAKSYGIERDKQLADLARQNVKDNKIQDLAQIYRGDILTMPFDDATLIYLYLMPELSRKLVPELQKLKVGTRIVCYEKPIPDFPIDEMIELTIENKTHRIFITTIKPITLQTGDFL